MAKKEQNKQVDTTLEYQIQECVKKCGLTKDEAHAAMQSASVGAIGDGVLLGKFLDFMKLLLPVLLPLIVAQSNTVTNTNEETNT